MCPPVMPKNGASQARCDELRRRPSHRLALAKAGTERVEGLTFGGIERFLSRAAAGGFNNILILLSILGNGVTVAQQTLTLFV